MNYFHALQYHVSDHAASAAGDREEGHVEESAFRRAHEERRDGVGEEAADEGGAHEFAHHRRPQLMGVAVEVAREEGAYHGAREGEEAAGAKEVSDEGGGEGRRRAIAGAAEDCEEYIDHVLQGKGFRHAQGESKDRREQDARRHQEGGKYPFAKGEIFFFGRSHGKDLFSFLHGK